MELEHFHESLLSSVRLNAEVDKNFVRASFVEEAANRLTDAEEITDFQPCHFEHVGLRKRRLEVDGYCFDEADGSMALVIADFYNEDKISTFGATAVRRCFLSLRAFVQDAIDGRLTDGSIDEGQPGYGLAAELLRLLPTIVRFRFYVVSDGQLFTRLQDWPEEDIAGVPIEFHIWDIARFHRSHESASGRDTMEISFCEDTNNGLPALRTGSAEGQYEAYLCMIPGRLLADVYERFGSRLLEGNVRSFLSTRGKVNSGIQDTIQQKPGMFFAYNNGIAATAEDVAFDPVAGRLKRAVNLQIVNGGQTTASLAAASRNGADLSNVCVQMKLSVLPPERASEMIPLIARFANSQNKVNEADFFANHPFHVRLEELSKRLWTPPPAGKQHGSHWFYERARGQYLNEQAGLTKAQKAKFLIENPRVQLLTKTDVAKFENTWRGFPHKVSFGAQKNFLFFAEWLTKEWAENSGQFNEGYYRYVVALAILFKHTEALVSKQSWYQGGYRANVVTYTLAKLKYMILKEAKGTRLDLDAIWSVQSVSRELTRQLEGIAAAVVGVLTASNRPKANVTEWAKMPACWQAVQDLKISLNPDLLIADIDPELERALVQKAAGLEPSGYGLFARTEVMGVDGRLWEAMRKWGAGQGMLTTRESDLLRAAARIPKFIPNAKDCEKILRVRAKLMAAGFSGRI